jgi:hypothetical protein
MHADVACVLLLLLLAAGLMVGKALYEGILLNMSFAPCFLLSLQVSCYWLRVLRRQLLRHLHAGCTNLQDVAQNIICELFFTSLPVQVHEAVAFAQ